MGDKAGIGTANFGGSNYLGEKEMIIQYDESIEIEVTKDSRALYARTISLTGFHKKVIAHGAWHLISLNPRSGIRNGNDGEIILAGTLPSEITTIQVSGLEIVVKENVK
jgi:hypothetical protein